MKNEGFDESLKFLKIDEKTIKKLEKVNIKTINDLWQMKRKELKALNFSDSEINYLQIKLQLRGLDLNKKIYN